MKTINVNAAKIPDGQGGWTPIPALGAPIDTTLSQAGYAADAKAVGDALDAQSDNITSLASTKADKTEVELKATKAELKEANRRIHLLEEAAVGKLYTQETVTETSYQQDVPSGSLSNAVLGGYGGKSFVWNQIVGEVTQITTGNLFPFPIGETIRNGHKYLTIVERETDTSQFGLEIYSNLTGATTNICPILRVAQGTGLVLKSISVATGDGISNGSESASSSNLWVYKNNFAPGDKLLSLKIIDLTLCYGSGSEPTTVDDPRIAEIEAYVLAHPEYNAGEIVSADVDDLQTEGKNLFIHPNVDVSKSEYANCDITSTGFKVINKSGTGWNFIEVKVPVKKAKYALSYKDDWGFSVSRWLRISCAETEAGTKTDIYNGGPTPSPDSTYWKKTFDVPVNGYLFICFYCSASSNITYPVNSFVTYSDIQVEYGDTVTKYAKYDASRFANHLIPSSVLSQYPLRSAGSVYDTITYEPQTVDGVTVPKWKHHKRTDILDIGSLNMASGTAGTGYVWYKEISNIKKYPNTEVMQGVCTDFDFIRFNGVANYVGTIATRDNGFLYINNGGNQTHPTGELVYQLENEVVTDITDLMQNWDGILEVEEGGTITFRQEDDTVFGVPNTINYLVKTTQA